MLSCFVECHHLLIWYLVPGRNILHVLYTRETDFEYLWHYNVQRILVYISSWKYVSLSISIESRAIMSCLTVVGEIERSWLFRATIHCQVSQYQKDLLTSDSAPSTFKLSLYKESPIDLSRGSGRSTSRLASRGKKSSTRALYPAAWLVMSYLTLSISSTTFSCICCRRTRSSVASAWSWIRLGSTIIRPSSLGTEVTLNEAHDCCLDLFRPRLQLVKALFQDSILPLNASRANCLLGSPFYGEGLREGYYAEEAETKTW